jgi:hypothetical protein
VRFVRLGFATVAVGTAFAAWGCVSIQAIEPVTPPPLVYHSDVTVGVEFMLAGQVGLRCAERGVKFLGLPGINSAACADANLVTMLDPCMTISAGAYAKSMCAARSTLSSLAGPPQFPRPAGLLSVSLKPDHPHTGIHPYDSAVAHEGAVRFNFVSPDLLVQHCRQQDLQLSGEPDSPYCVGAGMITLGNPCRSSRPGWYERTLCHELAHVNGWPADHRSGSLNHALPRASQSPEAVGFAARNATEAQRSR